MKAVLTVIAVALVWLCLKQPMPAAEAKAAPTKAAKPAKAVPVQEVVRARRFEVVGAKGNAVAVLDEGGLGNGALILTGKNSAAALSPGGVMLTDGVSDSMCFIAPSMVKLQKGRQYRASLETAKDGSPSLTLQDEKGVERVSLSLSPDGGAVLVLFDEKRKGGALLSVDNDGSSLGLYDKESHPIWVAP